MTHRAGVTAILVIILTSAALIGPDTAGAIEVKKHLYGGGEAASGGGPAPPNPLTPALRQKLAETIAEESDSYLAQESEKKSSGELYVDLEGSKFKYIPVTKAGKTEVTAKLEGPECKPPKGGGKGAPTGKRKTLVFKYRLDGQSWTEVEQPAWQDVEKEKKADKQ
jgi:hypothetical protein